MCLSILHVSKLLFIELPNSIVLSFLFFLDLTDVWKDSYTGSTVKCPIQVQGLTAKQQATAIATP